MSVSHFQFFLLLIFLLHLPKEVEVDPQQYQKAAVDVVDRKRLGEQHERQRYGEGFPERGHGHAQEGPEFAHERQDDLYAEISAGGEYEGRGVAQGRRLREVTDARTEISGEGQTAEEDEKTCKGVLKKMLAGQIKSPCLSCN